VVLKAIVPGLQVVCVRLLAINDSDPEFVPKYTAWVAEPEFPPATHVSALAMSKPPSVAELQKSLDISEEVG
jgi:hypothetical protein